MTLAGLNKPVQAITSVHKTSTNMKKGKNEDFETKVKHQKKKTKSFEDELTSAQKKELDKKQLQHLLPKKSNMTTDEMMQLQQKMRKNQK